MKKVWALADRVQNKQVKTWEEISLEAKDSWLAVQIQDMLFSSFFVCSIWAIKLVLFTVFILLSC